MIALNDIYEAMTVENKIKILNGAIAHITLAKEKNEILGLCWSITYQAYDIGDIKDLGDFISFNLMFKKNFKSIFSELVEVAKKHNAEISDTWWWSRYDIDVRIKVLKETIKLLEQ